MIEIIEVFFTGIVLALFVLAALILGLAPICETAEEILSGLLPE